MTREERIEAAVNAYFANGTMGDVIDAAFPELAAGNHWIAPMEPDVGMFGAAWGEAKMLMREAGGAIGKDELVHVLSRYWDAMRDAYLNPPPSADTEHGE